MILLVLMLQAAMPAAATPPLPSPAAAAETLKPIDAGIAIETFRAVCWQHFRDPEAFHAALVEASVPLAAVPRTDPAQAAEVYRSDEMVLNYVASDSLPANVPARQCRLRVQLAGAADQLALAARTGGVLKLPSGRTRTDPAGAETSWDVATPDGRIARLIVATRNAPRGGTELRLSALLLAPR
jgi:hypothetical protein